MHGGILCVEHLAVKTHVCAVQEKRLLARVHGAIHVLVLAC